jgi:arginyl-tRNA synthetase
LDADVEEDVRASRLTLAQLTGDILQRGLGLLGIETVEKM